MSCCCGDAPPSHPTPSMHPPPPTHTHTHTHPAHTSRALCHAPAARLLPAVHQSSAPFSYRHISTPSPLYQTAAQHHAVLQRWQPSCMQKLGTCHLWLSHHQLTRSASLGSFGCSLLAEETDLQQQQPRSWSWWRQKPVLQQHSSWLSCWVWLELMLGLLPVSWERQLRLVLKPMAVGPLVLVLLLRLLLMTVHVPTPHQQQQLFLRLLPRRRPWRSGRLEVEVLYWAREGPLAIPVGHEYGQIRAPAASVRVGK
jgi:hypothetical protein